MSIGPKDWDDGVGTVATTVWVDLRVLLGQTRLRLSRVRGSQARAAATAMWDREEGSGVGLGVGSPATLPGQVATSNRQIAAWPRRLAGLATATAITAVARWRGASSSWEVCPASGPREQDSMPTLRPMAEVEWKGRRYYRHMCARVCV